MNLQKGFNGVFRPLEEIATGFTKTNKLRVELEKAKIIAEELKRLLGPGCVKIKIAGSIRRQVPFVGDIELLCIPKYVDGVDQLDREIGWLMFQHILDFRLNKLGSKVYGRQNKLLVHLSSGIGVDIFSSTEMNWGMALLVRTGPKEWNIRVMSRLRELGMQGHAYGGVSAADGKEINCPDEEAVFRCLEWAYVPPDRRL